MFYQVLNAVIDRVFKENIQRRNNISLKKDTEKFLLLQVKDLIQIIVNFRTEKFWAHFYHLLNIFLRGKKAVHLKDYVAIL